MWALSPMKHSSPITEPSSQRAPLRRSLHADVPLPAVRAIVIWSHRLELARSWIPKVTDDPILAAAIEVVLAIAGESPSRAKELAFMRLGNVKDWDSFIEIEIAPSWASGRLKTASSQRRLIVRDPKSMAVIRRWILAREALGTGPGTLLFAGPIDRNAVYRRADMSRAIARLLRAASGDSKAIGHSLRHTIISMLNESVLMTSSTSDINRFRQVAVGSGHATGTTTLISYSHLYERALRGWLDAALI